MRFNEFTPESVAGPKNCWPGHRKTGTQAGTGKNAGKRVNDCEEIKEEGAGLNEFAPGSGGGESGRWYTDDQITDLVGDGWYNDLDVSGDIPKQEMMEQAQAWLDDQGYSVQVLNCKVNDDDMEWFIEGNFHNPRFAKKGVAEAKGLAKKVKVVKGEHAGKTGWIREIKHGAFKGAPKTYYIDLDDGGQANNLPATALRLVNVVDEASLATMRDYFAGDKNADDPSASSQQRNYFSKNDGSKPPVTKKFRSQAEYEHWLAQQKKDKQAFKVSEGVIIGPSETGDPMDPQVAVLGGAGSYSLKGLYNKAQRESSQLTKDIGLGNFRSSSYNVKQLANTLNTIVAAHNELEAIRKGGGAKSRGIERGVDYKE